jgi:hypothetical protein
VAYSFDFAISAQVSADTVEEMVKRAVEAQSGKKVESISFKTRMQSDPMDRGPGYPVFDGCTVHFAKEESK